MKTEKQYLVFTSSSYAYNYPLSKAKDELRKQLKLRNAKASHCYVADVSNIQDGADIYHDVKDGKIETSQGMVKVELIELH